MLFRSVLLIVGGIGGVMSKRAAGAMSKAFAHQPPPPAFQAPCPQVYAQPMGQYPQAPQASGGMPNWNWMGHKNPELDESWRPPPPPTTPPDYLEPDDEREEISLAREESE